jgi:WD40 repeat protein
VVSLSAVPRIPTLSAAAAAPTSSAALFPLSAPALAPAPADAALTAPAAVGAGAEDADAASPSPAVAAAADPLVAHFAGANVAQPSSASGTRWMTRFIQRVERGLARASADEEDLSRRAEFEDGEEAEPALRRSENLPSERPHEGWTRVTRFLDEKTIVTGGMDGTIRFIDVASGRLIKTLDGHSGVIRALDLSPDKRYLFSADDAGALLRWDLTHGDALQELQPATGRSVRAFRVSPDGRELAAGEHDGTLAIWDAASGRRLRAFALGRTVYDLAYSRDGNYVFAAGQDGVIRRVDARTGDVVEMTGHVRGVRAVAVRSTDGLLLSAGEDGTIRTWDTAQARETSRYAVSDKWVRSLAISPDGTALFTGNINGRVDRLELDANGRIVGGRALYAHDDVVFHTTLSPAGDFLVSSGRDLRLGIMGSDGRLLQMHGNGGPVHAMFVLADGKLVGVSHDGALLIWENPSSRPVRVNTHAKTARALAVAADGSVATGGDDRLVLLRRPGKDRPLELNGHTGRVRALAFSPDQKLLASSGDDRVLLLRDARTGETLLRLALPEEIEVVHALAFSPDGRRLAIGGRDGVVREVDVRTGKLLRAWERRHKGYIRSLAYRKDGRVLATGGRDGSLWLWETRSGRALRELIGHTDDVNSLDFDAQGRLLSASDDKTVRLWDTRRQTERVFRGLRPFSAARFLSDGAGALAIDDREELTSLDASSAPN